MGRIVRKRVTAHGLLVLPRFTRSYGCELMPSSFDAGKEVEIFSAQKRIYI